MINGHGDDLHLFDGGIKYNFSSNVYYQGCAPTLLNTLQQNIGAIENYPSPIAQELNLLAANKFGLDQNQFLFTNGATEAFYLIAQQFKGKSATIAGPTFSEYEDACRVNNISISFTGRSKITTQQITDDLVFICNPNNPDGAIFSLVQIKRLLQENPSTYFVLDEAYIEFTNKAETTISLLAEFNNLIIVRSLTKTFAIPGLRLGYIISSSNFIAQLLQHKMPWTVNGLAIEAGKYIFAHYQELSFDIHQLLAETEQLKTAIHTINWMKIIPGNTTYFLVQLHNRKAAELKTFLAEKHQILIRDATNFTGLEGEHIRLSIQSPIANIALIEALKQWN